MSLALDRHRNHTFRLAHDRVSPSRAVRVGLAERFFVMNLADRVVAIAGITTRMAELAIALNFARGPGVRARRRLASRCPR